MKPACAIELYASIRFMSVWVSATTDTDGHGDHGDDGQQRLPAPALGARSATKNTRTMAPTAAILVQMAMNPVTGVGAPT